MSKWNWAYGILQAHNIDTTDMQPHDALEKIKELRKAGDLSDDEAKTCDGILGKDRKAKALPSDKTNIKEQMRANADKLKGKKPVAAIRGEKIITDYKTAATALRAKLSASNGVVNRKGFGDIQVSSRLKNARAYIKKSDEIAAVAAIPAVIKNGIQIAEHKNHKGRNDGSVTFAGNVTIGDTTCMVAVVVKRTTENFYAVHRVLVYEKEDIATKKDTD